MNEKPCPTCSGPSRETVGMVCQTCGADYRGAEVIAYERGYEDGAEQERVGIARALANCATDGEVLAFSRGMVRGWQITRDGTP